MASSTQKVALVTGASSGMGHAFALDLQQAGFLVYGVARRVDRMADLHAQGIRTLAMDITDAASANEGIDRILAETGRIDVLVNNAGYGSYGPVEDVALEEARRQFEVNVFGASRLIQLVLPSMRSRRSGTIINITSMGGKIYTPFGAWYHATKFALESFSDCLRLETKPFGINVVIVEPGAIRTEWSGIAADHLVETSAKGAYAAKAQTVATTFRSEATVKQSSPPELVAKTVVKAATARRPKTRYAVGFGAKPLIFLRWLLSDRAFDAVALRVGGIR
ncbi:short-subunit dehydrogenase [Microbacterium resistens]|uniref:Short-subunit dehydrogenase n=1 Tax=Microbacterium resistens TaxID=156977 RepID=A0ABU1SFW9_9MICO|nr:oxidoreductase [Microbacterium resistens]MDR6868498.1 short-subunit dehydrogenase [Microbacterium resistens]